MASNPQKYFGLIGGIMLLITVAWYINFREIRGDEIDLNRCLPPEFKSKGYEIYALCDRLKVTLKNNTSPQEKQLLESMIIEREGSIAKWPSDEYYWEVYLQKRSTRNLLKWKDFLEGQPTVERTEYVEERPVQLF